MNKNATPAADHLNKLAICLIVALSINFSVSVCLASDRLRVLQGPTVQGMVENAGIQLLASDDDNRNAVVTVRYQLQSDPAWIEGHPFLRLAGNRMATSIFYLRPGSTYNYQVEVSDPDGVDGATSFTGQIMTRADGFPSPVGRSLYVSTNGNDSNSGTSVDSPFRTIQKAANVALPGDHILVQPGEYRESVVMTRSGSSAQPIVFESVEPATVEGSAPAVIEGDYPALSAGPGSNNWLPDPAGHQGIFYATLTDYGPSERPIAVYQQDEKIYAYHSYPYNATSSYENFINGIYYVAGDSAAYYPARELGVQGGYFYDAALKRLYVELPGGSDPDSFQVHVAKRNSAGFVIQGASNIVIKGFEIRHFHTGVQVNGSSLVASNNFIEGNLLHHNGTGIGLGGYGHNGLSVINNIVKGNIIFDSKADEWPWQAVKLNDVESSGITVGAGKGNIIADNRISHVFNGIDLSVWWALSDIRYNTEIDILGNEVFDVGDDSIEADSASCNVRIEGNFIHKQDRVQSTQAAISVAPVYSGPVFILRNVLTDFKQGAFKFASGYSLPVGPVLIYHNTVYSSAPELMALFRVHGSGSSVSGMNAVLRNNIFYAAGSAGPVIPTWDMNTRSYFMFDPASQGYILEHLPSNNVNPPITLDMDHDSFYSSRNPLKYFRWALNYYTSFSQLQSVSGQEAYGSWADPLFSDVTHNDFTLQPNSSLIDTAVPLPGINDAYSGSGPDVGAKEHLSETCVEEWSCSEWSECVAGEQARECSDLNACGTNGGLPILRQSCNMAPVIDHVGDKTVSEGNALAFNVTGHDFENADLSFSADGLPLGATFDASTGLFSWVPTHEQSGMYPVVFHVNDGELSDSDQVMISVENVDRSPVLMPIADQLVNEGESLDFTVLAEDLDGDDLDYSATFLPSGSSFDPGTHQFHWVPNAEQSGIYHVSFRVTDGTMEDSQDVQISVGNIDRAPVLGVIPDRTVDEGNFLSFTVSAVDLDGDPLSYSVSGSPLGAEFDARSGVFTWTPGFDQSGDYAIVFSVSDGYLSDSKTVLISVYDVNRAPVMGEVMNQEMEEGTLLQFTVSASDPDADPVVFSANVLPRGATFDSQGIFRWTPDYTQSGSYDLVFRATDRLGLYDEQHVVISVRDVPLPDAPTGLMAYASANNNVIRIFLYWDANNNKNIAGYNVYELSGSPHKINDVMVTENNYVWGITESRAYALAVSSIDMNGREGALSSPVTIYADPVAPASVNDLSVNKISTDSVVLSWTAVGDDGRSGMAAAYELRYSTEPIADNVVRWSNLGILVPMDTPKVSGSPETVTINGLSSGQTYYFSLLVKDDAGNMSYISNEVTALTSTPPVRVKPTKGKSGKKTGLTLTTVAPTTSMVKLEQTNSRLKKNDFSVLKNIRNLRWGFK